MPLEVRTHVGIVVRDLGSAELLLEVVAARLGSSDGQAGSDHLVCADNALGYAALHLPQQLHSLTMILSTWNT